ncbi:MAG: HIT family protein [Desulfobacca sp.]|nr:HIT family protein [Desulfobacca sp.]
MMSSEKNCIFCDIAQGRAEAHLIHEDELSLGFLDINPLAEGHCLIIPKRHVPWWHDLTGEETASLFEVARLVAGKIMKTFRPDFVCLYARGRRIPHTHIFLVPTSQGDPLDRFFNALEGFQEAPEGLNRLKQTDRMKETADRLRQLEP